MEAIREGINANMTRFTKFVNERCSAAFTGYFALDEWSIDNIPDFWAAVWNFLDTKASRKYDKMAEALTQFPCANCFSGAEFNFTKNLVRYRDKETAIVFKAETTSAVCIDNPNCLGVSAMWRLVDEEKTSFFETSATYINLLKEQNHRPRDLFSLSSFKSIRRTGFPLSTERFEYVNSAIKEDVYFNSLAGGTDTDGCFCMGTPILPAYAEQLQGPALGIKVKAYDAKGNPVYGRREELVCEAPVASLPLTFRGSPVTETACFTVYPNVRHGEDNVTFYSDAGGVTFFGRSRRRRNMKGRPAISSAGIPKNVS